LDALPSDALFLALVLSSLVLWRLVVWALLLDLDSLVAVCFAMLIGLVAARVTAAVSAAALVVCGDS